MLALRLSSHTSKAPNEEERDRHEPPTIHRKVDGRIAGRNRCTHRRCSRRSDCCVARVIVHGDEGLKIPPTPDGRVLMITIDSEQTPGLRMSMIAEDLPPKSEIRVHLHQREDEIIFIRMGTGVATLGDREVPVAAGATVYVPQGQWHGLRNNSQDMLGMTAIYSPAGCEQIFKDRLRNRFSDVLPADAS